MHGKFCDSCNRLRLTSTGEVKPCLCYGDTLSLREAARAKDEQRLQTLLVQAVAQKPKMHCFEEQNQITEGHKMAQIGG
jgi:cyclic pyranopterin phosphate synthase